MKVEFLLSSVRKWFEPWPQRWTNIFNTWNTRSMSRTLSHSDRKGRTIINISNVIHHAYMTLLHITDRYLNNNTVLTLSLTWQDSTCSLSRRYSSKHWPQPEDSWEISAVWWWLRLLLQRNRLWSGKSGSSLVIIPEDNNITMKNTFLGSYGFWKTLYMTWTVFLHLGDLKSFAVIPLHFPLNKLINFIILFACEPHIICTSPSGDAKGYFRSLGKGSQDRGFHHLL